jgi:hypothetical protein
MFLFLIINIPHLEILTNYKFVDVPILPETKLTMNSGCYFYFMYSVIKALFFSKPALLQGNEDDALISYLLVFTTIKARKNNKIVNL